MEYIKQIIPNFIQSGSLSPEIIFEAISTESLTDLKRKVQLAFAKQRSEIISCSKLCRKYSNQNSNFRKLLSRFRNTSSRISSYSRSNFRQKRRSLSRQEKLIYIRPELTELIKRLLLRNKGEELIWNIIKCMMVIHLMIKLDKYESNILFKRNKAV